MGNISESIAAATAIVGYDLMTGSRHQQKEQNRIIHTLGLTGSANAGDTEIELFIGDDLVGNFFNTTPGNGVWSKKDDIVPLGGVIVYPGEKIHAYVVTAPATNAINIALMTGDS